MKKYKLVVRNVKTNGLVKEITFKAEINDARQLWSCVYEKYEQPAIGEVEVVLEVL